LRDPGARHLHQLAHPTCLAPALVTARTAGTDLPSRVAPYRGTRRSRRSSTARHGSVRLLITGPGTGKTTPYPGRRDRPDGSRRRAFVDLSSVRDTVRPGGDRAVGLGEIIERDLRDELTDHLRERRMLVVLDNLEQVTEAASIVAGLLSDCPELTVLATSREALHVRAEQVFAVPPLALPPPDRGHDTAEAIGEFEAVELFVDRARVVDPEFVLTDDNAPAVAEICRRLEACRWR
jgi:non-specific serine/threonine protein kinase